jgi:preprotein translocase subunit SecG
VEFQSFMNIALILLSIALTVLILLQAHGGMGSAFGGDPVGGQYKTRRGLERTMFLVTIGFSVAFFVLVVLNVFVLGRLAGTG